jgi:hypothetical protein
MARLASGVVRQPTVREKRKRARAARLHAGSHQHSGNPGTVTVSRPRSRVVTLMLRAILEARALVALVAAAGVGTYGLQTYPVRPDEVLLAVIGVRTPRVFQVLVYGYGALSFTTPHYVASMIASLVTIIVYRRVPAMRSRPLPPYPGPEKRSTPMLVLGESHHHTTPGRAPQPTWLTIPQRGLYTGVMVLGAVGTGKTSACMYPYVDQLLRWRSEDPQRKVGGLVLEVKGDF